MKNERDGLSILALSFDLIIKQMLLLGSFFGNIIIN